MKIFISHSTKDKKLLSGLKQTLEPNGFTLLVAEHCKALSHTISEKVEKMIDECDVALVLLTKHGFNSAFVQQEIGYIIKAKKPMLQIVQKGLEQKISGFNFGRDCISLDLSNKDDAIERVRMTLLGYWDKVEMEKRKRQIALTKQQEIERQRRQAANSIALLAAVVILILVLSIEK